jgi:hypothetical protein
VQNSVNKKMRPLETISGKGREGIKQNDRGGKFS